MKRLTAEWVSKAEEDFRAARKLGAARPPLHDLACFCCQQTAEKYLKALLEEAGSTVPRTHALEDLLDRLIPMHPSLRALRRGLKFLIQFAVDARYPGFFATKRQARAALR
ncbi:MAG: HEPN domain-containing protein [Planctomycetia bacterium]|nr:HEPN domain-containing protein [Planctomycetia bacterium]